MYSFLGSPKDGAGPLGGLTQATDGKLYGATNGGGSSGLGTLFQITTGSAYKLLYSFTTNYGKEPFASLVQHTNGDMYGTAEFGGPANDGTVFSLSMGLGPFITFVQATDKAGTTAQILGQGLTGTSAVTFNGVAASSFSVVSDTYMTAVVPSGATSGPVVVTTPAGTLTSNVNFRISQ